MRSTGRRVSAGHSWPRGRRHTRSLSKGTPVFSARCHAHFAGLVIKLLMCGGGGAGRGSKPLRRSHEKRVLSDSNGGASLADYIVTTVAVAPVFDNIGEAS